MIQFTDTRPQKCLNCGDIRIAKLVYGFPIFDEELIEDLRVGRVILAGRESDFNRAKWQCNKCRTLFYQQDRAR